MTSDPTNTNDPETTAPGSGAQAWGWTGRQRLGLGILAGLLLTALALQYARRPARLGESGVVANGNALTLPTRTNPNAATELELSRIPHLGAKLAAKIAEYRAKRQAAGVVVFAAPGDLAKVPGMTKATLEQVLPYLEFPEDADTQPGE